MVRIQWQESSEFEPQVGDLAEFCRQNHIRLVVEPLEGQLLVLVDENALESLHAWLDNETTREHGGVLVGRPWVDRETGRPYIVIHAAPPALDSEGSSVHLQFTPETWAFISGMIDADFPDQMIVGWYHSHPGLGVFMSGTDRATQRAFYHHPWNVAIVADPIARSTGWFIGPDCISATDRQVIPFRTAIRPKPATSQDDAGVDRWVQQEYEAYEQRNRPDWRWLLPFGLIAAGAFGLAWIVMRNRMMGMKTGEQER